MNSFSAKASDSRNLISMALLAIALLGLAYYIARHPEQFAPFAQVRLKHWLALTMVTLAYLAAQGMILRTLLLAFDIRLGTAEWFGMIPVTLLGNFLFPFGGLGLRAVYLKKVHGFTYSRMAGLLTATYLVEFLIFTLGGAAGLLGLWLHTGRTSPTLLLLFIAIATATIIVMCMPFSTRTHHPNWLQWLGRAHASWIAIQRNPRIMLLVIGWTGVEFILATAQFALAYDALNQAHLFSTALLSACLSNLALIVRLLPAAFGAFEGSVVYTAMINGMTPAIGLMAAGLVRIATFFWMFLLGPIYSSVLWRRQQNAAGA